MPRLVDRRRVIGGLAAAGLWSAAKTKAAIGGIEVATDAITRKKWDYIIVGGGSAGCVLARRLSENPLMNVLLLEAGGAVNDPDVASPPGWPGLAGGRYDWAYSSTAQIGLDGRKVPEPRGKGLGGSTLINALGFQRGAHQAYDDWGAATGDAGWSFAGLLPYFRRLETSSGGADAWRGGDGPLHVLSLSKVADQNPLAVAFAAAGIAAGHSLNPDWNGARADGTAWSQQTIRAGQRDTAATAFIDPVRNRPNLGVATGALVTRLIIERRRCTGIAVTIDGQQLILSPRHDTILSAGALDSPRLLLLSGVGEADALARAGIHCVHDLPAVGRNLHDHPLVPGLLYRARRQLPQSHYNHCETVVVGESRCSPGWADLMLMGLSIPFLSPQLGKPPPGSFSIVPALLFPRSRGRLTVRSADPSVPALIDPAYLSDPADVEALIDGIDMARAIAMSAPLSDWIAEEIFPGPHVKSRAALAAHIRQVASPFFHPVSTCAMGRTGSVDATVDPQCRVQGLTGLRVVDASVFPSIPQAMTNAAVMAVAERAADLIRKG